MNFDPVGPLDLTALAKAHDFMLQLPDLEAGESLTRAYLHWPGGGYCDRDGAYNCSTVFENGTWLPEITHDPRCNAKQIADGDDYAAHTYHRNSFAIGCAINGMGPGDPIQEHELEVFLAMVGAIAFKYNLDVAGRVESGEHAGEPVIMTHAEAAIADGYWPDRVDLAALPPDTDYTPQGAAATATGLRFKARRYKLALGGP